jgi:hypothetical protein
VSADGVVVPLISSGEIRVRSSIPPACLVGSPFAVWLAVQSGHVIAAAHRAAAGGSSSSALALR